MIKLHLTPPEREWAVQTIQAAIDEARTSVNCRARVHDFIALRDWFKNAPNLEDGCEHARQEFGPGAGYGTNPHPNDDIHGQITTDPLRPQVPVSLAKGQPASEPGKIDITLPRVPPKG